MEDLYTHLVVSFTSKKIDMIQEELKKHETDDLFTKIGIAQNAGLKFLFGSGEEVQYMLNHPIPSFLYASGKYRELWEKSEMSVYEPLVRKAIDRGEIIDDEDLAFSVLSHTGAMTRQYLSCKVRSRNISDILNDEEAYAEAAEHIIYFIKQGLKA